MANIAISELNTTATALNDDDLILVSKTEDNGASFTSAKMKGSVLKSGVSGCQFSVDKFTNISLDQRIPTHSDVNRSRSDSNAYIEKYAQTQNYELYTELLAKIANKVLKDENSISQTCTLTLEKKQYEEDHSVGDLVGGGSLQ